MRLIRAFFMCLGMFTALPCPWRPWDEDARDWMLVTLPPVGLVVGTLWFALGWLGLRFLAPVAGAILAALPWGLTGFIHLDGYMDTCDAILSWRPLEKRWEILKDSHTGAFAVVGLAILAMFSYGAASALGAEKLPALVLVPVVSRCGSALAVLSLKPIGHSEYARMSGRLGQRVAVVCMWAAALIAGRVWLGRLGIALIAESLGYAAAMAWGYRTLEGVSGDVAGFALAVAECVALTALAAT